MRYIINTALFIFFCYSLLLIYLYISEIQEIKAHPEFKHASNGLLHFSFIILIGLVIADYFILRKFYRDIKKYGLF